MNEPTQEEIRRRCWEIQEGWTDRERRRRAGLDPDQDERAWQPPCVKDVETK